MKKFTDLQRISLQFILMVLLLSVVSSIVPLIYQETRWNIDWNDVPEDIQTNNAKFRCMTVAENGDLWAGNDNGVVHISGQTWETYSSRILHHIRDIEVAPNGDVWVLTQRNDVLRFDGQTWEYLSGIRAPTDIVITPDGTVWGVSHTGLLYFDGDNWQLSELPLIGTGIKDALWAVDVAPDGSLWIGGYSTDTVKLFHIINSQIIFTDSINIYGGIQKIRTNTSNQIWIYSMGYKSTTSAFGFYENGEWFDLIYPSRFWINLDYGYDFAPTNQGITWIATHKGLCRFNNYYCVNYLKGESIYSVATSPDGSVWLGLENQIVKLNH